MSKVLLQNVTPVVPQTLHWLSPLRALDEHVFFPMRRNKLTHLLAPYLSKGETILDVGSSCGRLAKQLMNATNCHIEGIDVCLQPHACIPVRHYDGQHFPFKAKAFDGVMLVDVLHHTAHLEQVLREAKRVARHYIIIKDHYWDTPVDVLGLKMADYIGNAPYGINLPYNYLKLSAWMQLFHEVGLKATNISRHRYVPMDPCKHVIFRLESA